MLKHAAMSEFDNHYLAIFTLLNLKNEFMSMWVCG